MQLRVTVLLLLMLNHSAGFSPFQPMQIAKLEQCQNLVFFSQFTKTKCRSLSPNGNFCPTARRKQVQQLRMGTEGVYKFSLDDLLCQRAVQTQLYYFAEFRDGFKRQWLEKFRGHDGLKDVHTFGALINSKEYLQEMLSSPPKSYEIRQQWGNRFSGGSKNNPFLKAPEERFTSYFETIAPQKICKGIMEIREQLVTEWIEDLALMPEDNHCFLAEQEATRASMANEGKAEKGQESFESYIGQNMIMANSASSPLRNKNYDVLKKAATYLAIQRVMRKMDRSSPQRHVVPWLKTWLDGARGHFLKDHGQRVADKALAHLFHQPMMAVPYDGSLRTVDPAGIVYDIMTLRLEVRDEWSEWLKSDAVRSGHTELQRGLLLRTAETWASESEPSQAPPAKRSPNADGAASKPPPFSPPGEA